ncbi:MAG: YdcF family protein [Gemmatimonadales bacterium]
MSRQDQARPSDAIVVLGAAHYNGRPSPVLKARVEHALALYHRAIAPVIVVTGGTHPGDSESEAAVQHRYLVTAGVPDSVIVELPQGQSTDASMSALGDWARGGGIRTVVLVSDGFHLARLRLEAARVDLAAVTSPVPDSPIARGSLRELQYLLTEALKIPIIWTRSVTE